MSVMTNYNNYFTYFILCYIVHDIISDTTVSKKTETFLIKELNVSIYIKGPISVYMFRIFKLRRFNHIYDVKEV